MIINRFNHLLFRHQQPALIEARRAEIILYRAKVVAALFAVLTPLWIPIDLLVFPSGLGLDFCYLRIAASVAFVLLIMSCRHKSSMTMARVALVGLLIIPTSFFMICQPLLAKYQIVGQLQQSVAASYSFLPFVMTAGLSVFPITALEGVLLCIPLWVANLIIAYIGYHVLPFETHLGAMWLLVLISGVATLSGMSQLNFMQQILTQSSHDGLTGAYIRQVGEELLNVHFGLALRTNKPFTVAFVDLDNFKSINDKYGHDHGDEVLRTAAKSLQGVLRNTDVLIRWGGEEFLLVMPGTDLDSARIPLNRIKDNGLGLRPDGSKMTASIGVADLSIEHCSDWAALVEIADHRMYAAKQTGKNRIIVDDSYPPTIMFAL